MCLLLTAGLYWGPLASGPAGKPRAPIALRILGGMMALYNFGFADVKNQYQDGYRKLDEDDKQLVRSFVKVILLFVIISLSLIIANRMMQLSQTAGAALEIGLALCAGIIVALSFSLFERVGILTPIESNIRAIMRDSKREADLLSDYDDYRRAKTDFGFQSVAAKTSDDGPGSITIDERGMDDIILDLFKQAQPGSSVDYMNSFVNSDYEYYRTIKAAVQRGVNVRMLLMDPDPSKAAAQARFRDYRRFVPGCTTMTEFIDHIMHRYDDFDGLKNEIEKGRSRKRSSGRFEIRYYSDALNFPLVTIRDPSSEARLPDVAYTGFFAGVSSESMPYLEWRGGLFRIIQHFYDLFEHKWRDSADKTHLHQKNIPKVN